MIYGQVKKSYQRRKLIRVTHVMRLGTQADLKVVLQGLGFSGRLNTAFIERVNLTVRHGVSALARRSWATSQQASQLLAHLEWWRAYYHGCRVPTNPSEWRSCSRESEVANGRRNAIGTGLPPWQLAEPPDDGRRARCSRAPCQKLPLESHRCQMRLQGHVGWKRVQVPAEEVGWTLLREEKASLDCSKTNIQPEVGLQRADPFIHHILSEHPQRIHSLRRILAPGCLPLFTSDGLNVYFYALTAHFGHWLQVGRRGRKVLRWQVAAELIYGQVKKSYRRHKLVRVTPVMRLGTSAALTAALNGLGHSGRLNTAFIERVNLTMRHGVAALARRTWATSQQASLLLAHLEWWRAYYHFVRPHQSLRVTLVQPRERGGKRLAQRYRQRTPAMAAGRTTRRWTAREVLSRPLPKVSA